MGVTSKTPIVYAIDGSDLEVMPKAMSLSRDPNSGDTGPLGVTAINQSDNSVWVLASKSGGTNVWTTSPASGVGAFTDVTINPGDLTVTAGDSILGGALTVAGLSTFNGNVTIGAGSTLTVNGDLDLSSAALIDLTSTLDADPSIYLHANGGTSEVIRLRADQGTAVNSIDLVSDVGGITFTATGLASADAINLSAAAGGIDVDAALQLNLASSQNAASAIVVSASAGGIDMTAAGAAGEDIDIVCTAGSVNITAGESDSAAMVLDASGAAGAIQLKAGTGGILIGNEADTTTIDLGDFAATASRTITVAGGQQVTAATTDLVDIAPDGAATNADSVKQVDICSGNVSTGQSLVNINTGTAASGTSTVNISTNTGGGTKTVNVGNADGLTTVNIDAIALINDSLNVNTSINTGTSTGVVAIGNGAAGAITLDSGAGISIDGATASNFTVTGAGQDLTLASAGGSVAVSSTEDAASAISLTVNGGVSETLLLSAVQGTSASSINLSSTAGGITLTSNLATADGINLNAIAGGVDVDSALQMNLTSAQAAVADSVRIQASAADGGIDIDAGTGGIAIDSTGAVSLAGAAASDFSVSGAGIDVSLISAAGRAVVNGEEAAVDAVRLLSVSGGLDADFANNIAFDNSAGNISLNSAAGTVLLDASGVLELNSSAGVIGIGNDAVAQNINIGTGAAARTITVGNVTGASDVVVDCGTGGVSVGASANAHTVTVGSTTGAAATVVQAGTGELALTSGTGTRGLISVDPEVATNAASSSQTVNSRVIHVTFTAITTAAGADEDITITSSLITTSSALMCNVSSISGGNDADLTIEGVRQAAGSIVLHCINSGPAAINTDVHVTVWVLS